MKTCINKILKIISTRNHKQQFLFILLIFSLYSKAQNINPIVNITVKLEYKKYTYCDSLCDAIFIKIKNETDKDIYIQSGEMLDLFIRIYRKCDGNCGTDWIWDFTYENELWYRNRCFCNQKFNDTIKSSLDYYKFILKSINNPDHFELNKKQIDSIMLTTLDEKMKKRYFEKPWHYCDHILFLNKEEEYTYIAFINYVKKANDYKKNETIKVLFIGDNCFYESNEYPFPKNIQGYSRWDKDFKSDTLMIKLE